MVQVGLAVIFSKVYFQTKPSDWLLGIKLAVVVMITSFLLDVIITVPLFVKDYGDFFLSWQMWFSIILALLGFAIGAEVFRKKKLPEPVIVEETTVIIENEEVDEL